MADELFEYGLPQGGSVRLPQDAIDQIFTNLAPQREEDAFFEGLPSRELASGGTLRAPQEFLDRVQDSPSIVGSYPDPFDALLSETPPDTVIIDPKTKDFEVISGRRYKQPSDEDYYVSNLPGYRQPDPLVDDNSILGALGTFDEEEPLLPERVRQGSGQQAQAQIQADLDAFFEKTKGKKVSQGEFQDFALGSMEVARNTTGDTAFSEDLFRRELHKRNQQDVRENEPGWWGGFFDAVADEIDGEDKPFFTAFPELDKLAGTTELNQRMEEQRKLIKDNALQIMATAAELGSESFGELTEMPMLGMNELFFEDPDKVGDFYRDAAMNFMSGFVDKTKYSEEAQERFKRTAENSTVGGFLAGTLEAAGFITNMATIGKVTGGKGAPGFARKALQAGTNAALAELIRGKKKSEAARTGAFWSSMYVTGGGLVKLLQGGKTILPNSVKVVAAKVKNKFARVAPESFQKWIKGIAPKARNFAEERVFDVGETINDSAAYALTQSKSTEDFIGKFAQGFVGSLAANMVGEVALDTVMGPIRMPGNVRQAIQEEAQKRGILKLRGKDQPIILSIRPDQVEAAAATPSEARERVEGAQTTDTTPEGDISPERAAGLSGQEVLRRSVESNVKSAQQGNTREGIASDLETRAEATTELAKSLQKGQKLYDEEGVEWTVTGQMSRTSSVELEQGETFRITKWKNMLFRPKGEGVVDDEGFSFEPPAEAPTPFVRREDRRDAEIKAAEDSGDYKRALELEKERPYKRRMTGGRIQSKTTTTEEAIRYDDLEDSIQHAEATGQNVAYGITDIRGLKSMNDTIGRAVVDKELLPEMYEVYDSAIKKELGVDSDQYIYGGDEGADLFRGATSQEAEAAHQAAEKAVEAWAAKKQVTIKGEQKNLLDVVYDRDTGKAAIGLRRVGTDINTLKERVEKEGGDFKNLTGQDIWSILEADMNALKESEKGTKDEHKAKSDAIGDAAQPIGSQPAGTTKSVRGEGEGDNRQLEETPAEEVKPTQIKRDTRPAEDRPAVKDSVVVNITPEGGRKSRQVRGTFIRTDEGTGAAVVKIDKIKKRDLKALGNYAEGQEIVVDPNTVDLSAQTKTKRLKARNKLTPAEKKALKEFRAIAKDYPRTAQMTAKEALEYWAEEVGADAQDHKSIAAKLPQLKERIKKIQKSTEKETDFFNGDMIEFTGKVDKDGLREFVYLEGHKEGQTGHTSSKEAKTERAKQKQKEFKEQQEGFRKLRELQEKETPEEKFERIMEESRQREKRAENFQKEKGKITFEATKPDGRKLIVSPDIMTKGAWRVTTVDDIGPSGHVTFTTYKEAVLEVLKEKADIENITIAEAKATDEELDDSFNFGKNKQKLDKKKKAEYTEGEAKEAFGSTEKADQAVAEAATEADNVRKKGPVPSGQKKSTEGKKEDSRSRPGQMGKALRKHGRVSLVGQTVSTPHDTAELFSIYRHPAIEHFHIVYVDDKGKILAHNAISAGLFSVSTATEDDNFQKAMSNVRRRMDRLGATGYYLVHNHPSGETNATQQDANITGAYAGNVKGFKGHVILDHETYAVMTENKGKKGVQVKQHKFTEAKEKFAAEGEGLSSPARIAEEVASSLQGEDKTILILLDSRNRIKSIEVLTPGKPINKITIHQYARAAGATKAVIASTNDDSIKEAVKTHKDTVGKKYDYILDAIKINKDGSFVSSANLGQIQGGASHEYVVKPGRGYVWEPPVKFQATPVFYSKAEKVIQDSQQKKFVAAQIRAVLKKQGVKPEEMEYSGLDKYLEENKVVTKDELLGFLEESQVRVKEVTRGKKTYEIVLSKEAGKTEDLYDAIDKDGVILFTGRYQDAEIFIAEKEEVDPGTKFENYTIPGGERYREMLLTLPYHQDVEKQLGNQFEKKLREAGATDQDITFVEKEWGTPGLDKMLKEDFPGPFKWYTDRWNQTPHESFESSHFDEPNILAHVRFNERIDTDGKKVLFLEEVQSDWHQAGRRKGYRRDDSFISKAEFEAMQNEANKALLRNDGLGFDSINQARGHVLTHDDWESRWNVTDSADVEAINRWRDAKKKNVRFTETVPDAPFKKTWHELALKRMVRFAADNDFDSIAWTTGEQQAERYDLSRQVRSIEWHRGEKTIRGEDSKTVSIVPTQGNVIEFGVRDDGTIGGQFERFSGTQFDGKHITDVIGKDIGEKILNEDYGDLRGIDLKIGGSGMKSFYDKILPSALKKIGKKFKARVGTTNFFGQGRQDVIQPEGDERFTPEFKEWAGVDLDEISSDDIDDLEFQFVNGLGVNEGIERTDPFQAQNFEITPELKQSAQTEGFPLHEERVPFEKDQPKVKAADLTAGFGVKDEEAGFFDISPAIEPIVRFVQKPTRKFSASTLLRSGEGALKKWDAGRKITKSLRRYEQDLDRRTGELTQKYADIVSPAKLSTEERERVGEWLDGSRTDLTAKEQKVADQIRELDDEMAKALEDTGVEVKLASGKTREFLTRKDHLAHIYPVEALDNITDAIEYGFENKDQWSDMAKEQLDYVMNNRDFINTETLKDWQSSVDREKDLLSKNEDKLAELRGARMEKANARLEKRKKKLGELQKIKFRKSPTTKKGALREASIARNRLKNIEKQKELIRAAEDFIEVSIPNQEAKQEGLIAVRTQHLAELYANKPQTIKSPQQALDWLAGYFDRNAWQYFQYNNSGKMTYGKMYGNIERARKYDVPGYYKDVDVVLPRYIGSYTRRLTEIETMGAKDEKINALIEQLPAGKPRDYAQLLKKTVLKQIPEHGAGTRILRNLRGFSIFTSLGRAAVQNVTQPTLIPAVTSMSAFGKAMKETFLEYEQARRFAEDCGAIQTQYADTLLEKSFTPEPTEKLAKLTMGATGFSLIESGLNRTIAPMAGRYWAIELADEAQRAMREGKDPARWLSQLNIMGIDTRKVAGRLNSMTPSQALTSEDLKRAGHWVARETQFGNSALDTPLWTKSQIGKTFTQYWSFQFQAWKMYSNAWKRALRNKSAAQAAKLVMLPILTGELIQGLQYLVFGWDRDYEHIDNLILRYGARGLDDLLAVGFLGWGGRLMESITSTDPRRLQNMFAPAAISKLGSIAMESAYLARNLASGEKFKTGANKGKKKWQKSLANLVKEATPFERNLWTGMTQRALKLGKSPFWHFRQIFGIAPPRDRKKKTKGGASRDVRQMIEEARKRRATK